MITGFVVDRLSVKIGRKQILEDINLSARAGEMTTIVGPNGSGKTTLMRALTGELAGSGSISIRGHALNDWPSHKLATMRAVLTQETTLTFPFTVAEVVTMGILAGSPLGAGTSRSQRIGEALAAVDLEGFAARPANELSGGERQRVQLARVLCQIWEPIGPDGPRWLLLDEPVSSLDIRHQLQIMELAADYARRGGGVITVMHDLNLTAIYADQIILMQGGQIAAVGTPDEVLTDDILEAVFQCSLKVGQVPTNSQFVLPHRSTELARLRRTRFEPAI